MSEPTTVTFTVRGRMPTQNELIELRARSPHAYNRRKKEAHAMVYMAALGLKHTFDRVAIELTLLEPNQNFDPDNIACGALKCILDALQRCGVLLDDGWDNVSSIYFSWATSPEGPAVRVAITGEANVSTTPRQRRTELGRREHRQKAARAKKAAERAKHHGLHGKDARADSNARGQAPRPRLPVKRR